MKTTLELPDDLMQMMKLQAAERNRKLKDVIEEVIRRGLATTERSEANPLEVLKIDLSATPMALTPTRMVSTILNFLPNSNRFAKAIARNRLSTRLMLATHAPAGYQYPE